MYPSANTTPSVAKWQDLHRLRIPTIEQLESIKSHLDLVIVALEAITNINSETIVRAATTLNLDSITEERAEWWRSSQNHRNDTEAEKKLDVEEARSLVLIICYLAKQEKELIRRAVSLLEQATAQNEAPRTMALLEDYLNKFISMHRERINHSTNANSDELSRLALKLLVDLLFYSGSNGHRLLWLAVLGKV